MNFRFQPFLFPSILAILSIASFSPVLKAQDLNNVKPTTPPIDVIPQPMKVPMGTGVNPSERSQQRTLETQSSQENNTPASTNCQGKTPSTGQPGVPAPTGSMNSPESKIPRASELMAPLEEENDSLSPSSPVPQSQPTSPSR